MLRLRGMTPITFVRAYLAGHRAVPHPKHVFVCLADHFEPDWRNASATTQRQRVDLWLRQYVPSINGINDSRGRSPQHTFFYPIEAYEAEFVEDLAGLARAGYGDVEIHLHHDDDHSEALRELLLNSVERFHDRHGLLTKDATGQLRYGFIHGNWALDNSRPDGRYCGVNDELTVLRETGCYADFTLPSAPSPTQTRTLNSIYYAIDDPNRPKSHDTGVAATRFHEPPHQSLLMIQGPLVIAHRNSWHRLKIENGNLIGSQPPSGERINNWLRASVSVVGHESWQFIKLHTHGAQERNSKVLLGSEMRQMHATLRTLADQRAFAYYYVTAREMAQLVSQAERGFATPDFDALGWQGDTQGAASTGLERSTDPVFVKRDG